MTRRIPEDRNYHTSCPAAIKAKITALEGAVMDYAFAGSQPPEDREQILQDTQFRRYNLERTILTCIDAAVKAALDPDTKRTK
jgi:Txe/YoeB family toxin of Txe-Axe toxin-antitoxin module